MLDEGNQIHNFISSSGSGTVINYDFLTSYGSCSASTFQKVTVPTVPVPQRCLGPVVHQVGVGLVSLAVVHGQRAAAHPVPVSLRPVVLPSKTKIYYKLINIVYLQCGVAQ